MPSSDWKMSYGHWGVPKTSTLFLSETNSYTRHQNLVEELIGRECYQVDHLGNGEYIVRVHVVLQPAGDSETS